MYAYIYVTYTRYLVDFTHECFSAGVPGGLVGGPRATATINVAGFESNRVHTRKGVFFQE